MTTFAPDGLQVGHLEMWSGGDWPSGKEKCFAMRYRLLSAALLALSLFAVPAVASGRGDALSLGGRLYHKGHYHRALEVLECVPSPDAMSEGYALLCKAQLRTPDYERAVSDYESRYSRTALTPQISLVYGRSLFDEGRYAEALSRYDDVPQWAVSYKDYTEVLFKRAYCSSAAGDSSGALALYEEVIGRRRSDFTAPSLYAAGYILYSRSDFAGAESYFSRSARDGRFRSQSEYYILECRFMQRDYAYVTEHGGQVYADAPEARRPHLARILSEAYLVTGDAARAGAYFKYADEDDASRADLFYAGSLQYALRNWRGAADKFSRMGELTDSIGQIAAYQLGYSYIQLKDKVSAMDAFLTASKSHFDEGIREDAALNHAKLAFDLNYDSAPFEQYMRQWPQSGKNDMIYDYIAVASLYKHDYSAAIAAYDRIDQLSGTMRSNYVKANYLLAAQLIGNGSYTDAIEPLNAVTAYAGRSSQMGKLSRYWLGEAQWHTGKYAQAGEIFTSLYNNSALDDRAEGKLLPYNIAYCYYRSEDWQSAARWFAKYLDSRDGTAREDALLRRADCYFIRQDYKEAVDMYASALEEIRGQARVYPIYQEGLALGFLGKPQQKSKTLSEALSADPLSPFYSEAVYELGRTRVSLHRETEARAAFNTLAHKSPDSTFVAKAIVELALMDRNAGNYESALDRYKQVVENYGRTDSAEGALMAIESIYQSRGEVDKYYAYVERIGRPGVSDTEKEQAFFNSVEQIYRTGNYEQATVALGRYLEAYPDGADAQAARWYMAESWRSRGDAEKALQWYGELLDKGGVSTYSEPAMQACAEINSQLGRYGRAYELYSTLRLATSDAVTRLKAEMGMLESAYSSRDYAAAIAVADMVSGDSLAGASDIRRAHYVKAKSLLSTSRREEAYGMFESLASAPATAEGAEASYLLIQDVYDRGQFDKVEPMVYAFADKAAGQPYWLAKSYIVLGDSFVENDNIAQARVTFKSVIDGYEPQFDGDDVKDIARDRLSMLDRISTGE